MRTLGLTLHTLCKGLCRLPSCNSVIFVHVSLYPRSKPLAHYTCSAHSVCCIQDSSILHLQPARTRPTKTHLCQNYTQAPCQCHGSGLNSSSCRVLHTALRLKLVLLVRKQPCSCISYEQTHTTCTALQVTSYLCFRYGCISPQFQLKIQKGEHSSLSFVPQSRDNCLLSSPVTSRVGCKPYLASFSNNIFSLI